MTEKVRLSLDEVRTLCTSVLKAQGLSSDHVHAVTETIVAGERDGCPAHGLYRLLVCAHTIRSGKVSLDAKPKVLRSAPAIVHVDARGAFAQLAFKQGRPALISCARIYGMAALAINNCVHFAALWPEVEQLANDGLVALAVTPSHAWVAPAGGRRPVFGTNPIAFSWPRAGKPPYVFDFATSAVARGEIELHARQDKPIPIGWGVGSDGNPTTSAASALAGAMLTFGGHKGSALATMVELLAGPLIGDMTSRESLAHDAGAKASPLGGELILVLNPASFLGEGAQAHLDRAEILFDEICGQGARLPSQRRYDAREQSERGGVQVDATLLAEIKRLIP